MSLNVTATRRNGRMIIFTELQTGKNRPLPSSKNPLFQNEAKCTNFLVEMSFICVRMTNHFHIQGWALNLVLIQRPGGTRKWPMKFCCLWLISPAYLGVRTCNFFFCFAIFVFLGSILSCLLCFLCFTSPVGLTGSGLHRGWANFAHSLLKDWNDNMDSGLVFF